jgi:hypothetical protein
MWDSKVVLDRVMARHHDSMQHDPTVSEMWFWWCLLPGAWQWYVDYTEICLWRQLWHSSAGWFALFGQQVVLHASSYPNCDDDLEAVLL